ncbi:hypothetical protein L6164_000257 [Bauhinia variegata]|uniref:Uncharacterized protein n=1 Tax=Bauhinia variegata TaxID=167791 RepID=A0ACB9Q5Z3_BAUVA|nr:hypothetical protein L6164_000257 [Bauhinia variegata]
MALLFRSYIGPKSEKIDINFTDLPIYRDVNFNFLLAFARDYDKQNFLTNGIFYPYWNEYHFGPNQVNDIVGKYPNVKVFASIGSHDDHFPFNPTDPKKWIENAVTSLGKIIDDYDLDGIDCPTMSRMSTWPWYQKYKQYIDYVGYQFYAEDDPTESVEEFLVQFKQISRVFDEQKLVAGFSSDKEEIKKLTPNVFFKGCQKLKAENALGGISIWSADDSKPEFENKRKA